MLVLALLGGGAAYVGTVYRGPDHTLFARALRQIDLAAVPAREGVIRHMVEDFSTYADCSRVLDPFETVDGLTGNVRIAGTSSENRGGERSVRVVAAAEESKLSRPLSQDLSRWREQGVISFWIKLGDAAQVDRIDLVLRDASGQEARLKGLANLHLPPERNQIKSDDDFPDYYFRGRQPNTKWEDFLLISGWNFVFWEITEPLAIDFSQVASYTVVIVRNTAVEQEMLCDNLRIQDGLLGDRNALGGRWYPPNGLPMYGVFDYDGPGRVRLQNVEWDQYPSNGDHVRILSREGTPEDFIMRLRFKVVSLAPKARWTPRWLKPFVKRADASPRYNTYFRLQWDFDNEYDPGHDWSGLYNGFEYSYLGLCRVYPIERYFDQGAEPDKNAEEGRMRFSLEDKRAYEIDVKVEGHNTVAEVYEIRGKFLKRVARVAYTFRKDRPKKCWPISVETTGNIQIELNAIEVAAMR